MGIKKRIVIIIAAVFTIFCAIIVIYFYAGRYKTPDVMPKNNLKDDAGIHYGGDFDEFQYQPEEVLEEDSGN